MASSASGSASTATQQHPFQRRIDESKPSKTDINFVVMDYLISEGYPRAAAKFAAEANIHLPEEDEELIQARVEIRRAIHACDIDTAINMINDLNPQILDTNPALHFALLRLQLIELIRSATSPSSSSNSRAIIPAINFASSQLGPRAATNPAFQKDLELAMTLLIALPSDNLRPELAELVAPELRRKVASEVNATILVNMGEKGEARMWSLYRLRQWSEEKARKAGKDLPSSLPLGLQDIEPEGESGMGNGAAADVMVQ